jgi:molybdate transport system substrate-binding protein
MKRLVISFVISIAAFAGNSAKAQQQKITVAVAANMQYAFNDLKNEFEKSTNIHVDEVVGASGNLTQQIMQGAPFDVFLSADTAYTQKLFEKGFAAGKPRVYTRGLLVLWTTVPGLKLTTNLQFLLSPKIKSIAIANPKTAPYGTAAEALLKKYNLLEKLKGKIVYGESISQTSQFIGTQNADVGFTAKAIVLSKQMKGRGKWIEINPEDYPPILQSAVLLKYGVEKHSVAAKKFYEFLYSANAEAVYKKYGYMVGN